MNLSRPGLALPLLAAIAVLGPAAPVTADPPPTCSIAKSGKNMTCPKSFEIVTDPQDDVPETIYVDQPISVMLFCEPRRTGMLCEGWPQEYDSEGYLTYRWSIRVGGVLTHYPATTNPVRTVTCSPLQPVEATLTVTNGTYQASATQSYGCGNQIQ